MSEGGGLGVFETVSIPSLLKSCTEWEGEFSRTIFNL
jgi:hypothetical protein